MLKQWAFAAACAAIAVTSAAGDVGISINVGEPGFFGQINIGGIPQPPPLLYPQPVVVSHGPDYVPEPIYLHVPPGHERYWSRHCAEYHACGRPVYFVRDDWYRREYVPHYQRGEWGHEEHWREEERAHEHWEHDHDRDRDHDHDHDHWHDHDHDH